MNRKISELLTTVLLEKNITFLIGAGASTPFFSSLGNLENILTHKDINKNGKMLIKSIFYDKSIANNEYLIEHLQGEPPIGDEKEEQMLSILIDYKRFLHNILEYLKVRNSRVSPKRANIITTNYDIFIETAIDDILEDNPRVYFNDGTNGYIKRTLQTDNFNKTLLYSGVFDNYSNEMPTINLIKCHGSVNWHKYSSSQGNKERIQIFTLTNVISELNIMIDNLFDEVESYMTEHEEDFEYELYSIDDLCEILDDEDPSDIKNDINLIGNYFEENLREISNKLDQIQIVFPTKKKFESTLVNEFYFSLLRLLSYELEKEQSTLIVFGFSFYDEHITEIVQRSLNNPNLLVIIFCYTTETRDIIISNFNFTVNSIPNNVQFVVPNDFALKTIDITMYKEEYDDENLENRNIVYDSEQVTVYSDEVSFIRDKNRNKYAVLRNNSFHSGSSYLPMIGNTCTIPNDNDINLIYINNYAENEKHLITIGRSLIEKNIIKLPVNSFFASHIGIFGNTGSGKSNTLHKIYYELFNLEKLSKMKYNSRFLLLDFNDEYTQFSSFGIKNDGINKQVFKLKSTSNSGEQKFPIEINYFFNEEILSILFQATQQTQKPFLHRVIRNMNKYGTGSNSLANWIISLLTKIITGEPNRDILNRILNILDNFFPNTIEYLETLKRLEIHSNGPSFHLEEEWKFFNGALDQEKSSILKIHEIRNSIENHTIDLIDEFELRCNLQLVSEMVYGNIIPEHIEPLLKRIETRIKNIQNYIELVDKLPFQPFLQIVSLKSLNQEAKKILSLLITKMYFDKHKQVNIINNKSFHLIVDEAHNILSSQSIREQESWKDYRLELFEEIIKEGRKFSFFLTISSQRPADISPTILSQVHNFFLHKLVNEKDLQIIDSSISTLDQISKSMLPILSQGVCIISGTAITMPITVSIDFIEDKALRPKSDTIQLTDIWE